MQIDWWTLGLQTINFLIVVWLLSRFLYRPVRQIIEKREEADRKLSEEAQAKTKEAEKAKAEYEKKLADFAEEQRRKEAELQTAMEKERDTALEDAQRKAEALLANAKHKAQNEREEALRGLKAEIAGLALELARSAFAGGGSQQAIMRSAMERLANLPKHELADLKKDVGVSTEPIRVVTAEKLDEGLEADWRASLADAIGKTPHVAFSQDPDLLGGARLQFPHAVLDLSVAGRLRDATEGMKV